jgi:hypothetical protein
MDSFELDNWNLDLVIFERDIEVSMGGQKYIEFILIIFFVKFNKEFSLWCCVSLCNIFYYTVEDFYNRFQYEAKKGMDIPITPKIMEGKVAKRDTKHKYYNTLRRGPVFQPCLKTTTLTIIIFVFYNDYSIWGRRG